MAVQYFVGNNAETALYFLLVILKFLSKYHIKCELTLIDSVNILSNSFTPSYLLVALGLQLPDSVQKSLQVKFNSLCISNYNTYILLLDKLF